MTNPNPETPEQQYNRIYKELYIMFHRERLPIHIVADMAQDLLISCAISACNGDQQQAGIDMRDHLIPEINRRIEQLLANGYPVVHITERDTALDNLDVSTMKPN